MKKVSWVWFESVKSRKALGLTLILLSPTLRDASLSPFQGKLHLLANQLLSLGARKQRSGGPSKALNPFQAKQRIEE